MTLAQAIQHATATPVILAEITAGLWCRAWVVDGTLTNTYKISTTLEVDSVRWNRDTLLTEGSSASNVNSNAGYWFWDGAYLWVRPLTGSIFAATIQAMVIFRFGNHEKVLNNLHWEPRIDSAPNLSKRIEAVFGDVGQIGGGQLRLHNADQYFNELQTLQWHAGTVTLKLGIDTPAGDMAWADYQTLAVWNVEDWSRDESSFSLRLIEPKSRVKTKLPFTFLNLTDYPSIDADLVGKAIPIAYGKNYGRSPFVIDAANRTFLVAGHAIKRFLGVRIRKSRDELFSTTTVDTDWQLHSGDTYRYYRPEETITNVTSDGDSLTEVNSIDDVVATNGSWYAEQDWVYVNPQGGETISSETYVIKGKKTTDVFTAVDFETTDAAAAEFTLSDEWVSGTEVSVDFEGKPNADNTPMDNAVDIIEDILTTLGETNLNAASFTEARTRLAIGTTFQRLEYNVRKPAVYIDSPTESLEIIGDILAVIGGYLYSDSTGQWTIGIMQPEQGEALPLITDLEILDFSEGSETSEQITKALIKYKPREMDSDEQILEYDRDDLQAIANQADPVIRESNVTFWEENDASYYAQRMLILEGQAIRKVQISTAWSQMLRNPGDHILVQSEARDIDDVWEVLEVRTDLGSKRVTLTLGNIRGFEDSVGFWVANADVLPTRFSNLTGYGAGSLVWNSSWDSVIKRWARQNVGYWTNANGFANASDPESYIPSAWF